MKKSEFQTDLVSKPLSILTSKWVLERIPSIFGTDSQGYIEWKEQLASGLRVDSRAMLITGSASCGFSLSPWKEYRDFDSDSDIDVALVSQRHFDLSWHALRTLGPRLYSLTPKQRTDVQNHVERLIYWGTIAADKILPVLPFAKEWNTALENAAGNSPIDGREVKVRIYRDFESLKSYQVTNFEKLRDALILQ
ncbi:MAG: hypothetical protein ABI791_05665 [Acidobacteriota bacterium]